MFVVILVADVLFVCGCPLLLSFFSRLLVKNTRSCFLTFFLMMFFFLFDFAFVVDVVCCYSSCVVILLVVMVELAQIPTN